MTSLFDAQWAPGAVRADQERARNEAAELAYVNAQKAALPQGGAGPGAPSDVYTSALINSGNPQAMQRGFDMRERQMAERRQVAAAVAGEKRRAALAAEGERRRAEMASAADEAPTDLLGNNQKAGLMRAWLDPNTDPALRRMIRAELQREHPWTDSQGNTHIAPGMTDYDLGVAEEPAAATQERVIEKGMSEKGKDLGRVLRSAEMSANRYRTLLAQYGSEGVPGVGKDKLRQAYNDLKLKLKEGYALGVLSGGDEVILEKVLPDPTAWYNQLKSGGRLLESFDSTIGQNLKSDREIWESQYGSTDQQRGQTQRREAQPDHEAVDSDGWGVVTYE